MEQKLQSSWEAIQSLVIANPRIHAISLRRYAHVWADNGKGQELYSRDESPKRVTRREILAHPTSADELRERIDTPDGMHAYWDVALSSQVEVKRKVIGFLPGRLGKIKMHFALLDMDLPFGEENEEIIRERVSELLVPEYGHFLIAESGKSYHAIGIEPMSLRRLRKAYGSSLLLDVNRHISPDGVRKRLVDTMYIGHCLADRNGTGNLRLTGNLTKPAPRVVGIV